MASSNLAGQAVRAETTFASAITNLGTCTWRLLCPDSRRTLRHPLQASKVHELASSSSPAPGGRRGAAAATAAGNDEAGLTPEEFQRLHLEVEKFGEAGRGLRGWHGVTGLARHDWG